MSTCNDCEYCEPIDGLEGKCKQSHAERHVIPVESHSGAKETINGWPKVLLTEGACGEFEPK